MLFIPLKCHHRIQNEEAIVIIRLGAVQVFFKYHFT